MKNLVKFIAPCSLLLATATHAQESPDTLAERLVSLRGQVDSLQSELDIRREEHKNRMVYLTAQLAELEASRDREALRVKQLQKDLAEMRAEIESGGVNSESLLPFVLSRITELEAQISSGLPFKTGDRLAELDELATQLQNGVITAQRGVNRLWAFVEDEIRISRENAIYSQSVTINGRNVLVDVAKLGNAMMFFRTRNMEYGRAVYDAQGWRFELLESNTDREQVAGLFDALRKQIRQGYFELPVSLPPRLEEAS
jgi:hypothetical protein